LNSFGIDTTNSVLYIGGGNGTFGSLLLSATPASATFSYLYSKIEGTGGFGANAVVSMAYDSAHSIMYLAGPTASIGAYAGGATPANGTFTSLQNDFAFGGWGYNAINGIAYDSVNSIIYAVGYQGRFASVTALAGPGSDVYTLLSTKLSTDWGTNNGNVILFNSSNNLLYLAGQLGHFGTYTTGATPSNGTWTNLYSNVDGTLSGYDIDSSAYDSTNGFLYLGGANGEFMSYKLSDGTATNLTSKISSDWSTKTIDSIAFDSINGVMYLCGDAGKFGSFVGGSTPASGTWTYLNSKISADFGTNSIETTTFDSTNGIVYLGATGGKFGAFAGGATPANGTYRSHIMKRHQNQPVNIGISDCLEKR
jgi:hypothetical protein